MTVVLAAGWAVIALCAATVARVLLSRRRAKSNVVDLDEQRRARGLQRIVEGRA